MRSQLIDMDFTGGASTGKRRIANGGSTRRKEQHGRAWREAGSLLSSKCKNISRTALCAQQTYSTQVAAQVFVCIMGEDSTEPHQAAVTKMRSLRGKGSTIKHWRIHGRERFSFISSIMNKTIGLRS